MRGILFVFMAGLLLAAGCIGPEEPAPGNVSNQSNLTAPVEDCEGPVCGADNKTYSTDCEAALADVSILHDGECIEAVPDCVDSDNGLKPEDAGVAYKGGENFSDYCLDDAQLVEYACVDGNVQMNTVQCGAGKECADGSCSPIPEPENITEPAKGCTGPIEADIYKPEWVTMDGVRYNDSCVEYTVVKDYYCKDEKMESINHQCPPGYGCEGGKCFQLSVSCIETDSGNDTSVRGKTTVLKGMISTFSGTDECMDEVVLKEYYCLENGSYGVYEGPCPSGTKCLYDRCIQSKCSENDGGVNIFKWGITRNIEGDFEDDCMSDHTIREYSCYGDEVRFDDIDCGDGFICNDDTHKCVEGSVD